MVGMMPQNPMPEERAPAQGGAPAPQGVAPEVGYQGEGNVAPEEQAAYDKFVDNGFKLIYDDKTMPNILNLLQSSQDKILNLASAALNVVMHLKESAKNAGREIPPDILMHGGVEILEDLAELSDKAGIYEYSQDEIEGATYRAFDMYREMEDQRGETDQEARMAEMQELAQAEKDGRLGEMFGDMAGDYNSRFSGQNQPRESEGV